MARPRGGTALFDLLDDGAIASRDASPPQVDSVSARSPDIRTARDAGDRPVVIGAVRSSSHPGVQPESAARSGAARKTPLVQLEDDSVRVTLTSGRTAAAVFVLCAVLVGSFEWGRHRGNEAGFVRGYDAGRESYAADTMSEIEAARRGAVAPGLVDDLTVGSAAAVLSAYEQAVGKEPSPDDGVAAWVSGHTYVVAQGFSSGREADAEQAQAFLASRGIETVLVRFESGAMQLITVQGFNRTDRAQRALADRLLSDVHDAGREYFASGGGYRLEGYFATFKGDRW